MNSSSSSSRRSKYFFPVERCLPILTFNHSRHALIFPWGQHPKAGAPGRELYIVPLLKDQPIPEYIELLDNHHLPAERTEDILLGVFVLNKGKLAAAATPPIPGPVPVPARALPFNTSSTPPAPPGAPSYPTNPVTNLGAPPVPAAPVKIDQATLAAEVATLTPEQISFMLRHLSQSAPQLAAAQGPTPAVGFPPAAAPHAATPPYNQQYPGFQQSPPPAGPGGPFPYASPDRPTGDYDGAHKQFGREERGRRGRGRPRGPGRGRGGRHSIDDGSHGPAADSGWRGRGRGGQPPGGPQYNRGGRF